MRWLEELTAMAVIALAACCMIALAVLAVLIDWAMARRAKHETHNI